METIYIVISSCWKAQHKASIAIDTRTQAEDKLSWLLHLFLELIVFLEEQSSILLTRSSYFTNQHNTCTHTHKGRVWWCILKDYEAVGSQHELGIDWEIFLLATFMLLDGSAIYSVAHIIFMCLKIWKYFDGENLTICFWGCTTGAWLLHSPFWEQRYQLVSTNGDKRLGGRSVSTLTFSLWVLEKQV